MELIRDSYGSTVPAPLAGGNPRYPGTAAMLTGLALLAVVVGTLAVVSNAAGGCLLSNLFLHLGDAVEAVGQLAGVIATSLTADE